MGQITGNGTAVTGLGGAAGYGELMISGLDEGSVQIDARAVFENGLTIGGVTYAADKLFVNVNGMLGIGGAISGLPIDLAAMTFPFIAPFKADVDIRLDGEGAESGPIWVDIEPINDVITKT